MPDLRSRIVAFCKRHKLQLDTDLGQHFLVDESILEAITQAAQIKTDDHIFEIGAGIGVLTEKLLQLSHNVTSIEVDPRLPPLLKQYIGGEAGRLTLIEQNALQVPFPKEPYKIVANIPYHITSPLLRHAFLEGSRAPQSLTLLIQREVAQKICDAEDAGLLTIIVGLFGTPRIVTRVPASAFLPPPKVESAVLHIDCFSEPRVDGPTMDRILVLAKHAFHQKRKMLRNSLGSLPEGTAIMEHAGIDPMRRPQTLSIDEWITLARAAA